MKKIGSLLLCFMLLLSGCKVDKNVDIDMITGDIITPAIAYSTAAALMQSPENYLKQTVQAEGCIYARTDSKTGITYHFIDIADVKGCCNQPLEITLAEGMEYPDEETIVYVYGIWNSYLENGSTFYRIEADRMELSRFETVVE
ncbi:MAG: hypothetical protein IJN80_01870 [Clostridia bacterium]|nr:hypothetical protein [Clostridia bacterium]